MNRLAENVLVIVALAALAACTTITARSDYYREADFSGFRSFAWMTDPPVIVPDDTDMAVSALNLRRIKESIETELTAKGFTHVPDEAAADFVISATVGARDQIDLALYPDRYRDGWRWEGRYGVGTGVVGVDRYLEGTLAIDVFDEASKQAVWHGWATKRITNADIEDAGEPIREAVAAILSEFPPEP